MKATKKDLSHISREEKLEIIRMIEEKALKEKRAKPLYKPHAEQIAMHKSDARERFVFCGNSWGKTTALVNEAMWAALGYNPITDTTTKVPATIIIVLDSPEKVEKKIKPEIKKWFDLDGLIERFDKAGTPTERNWHFNNGSVINFLFFEMTPEKFEGVDGFDYIFTDEPFPKYIYTGLLRGTREIGSDPRLLLVGTPLAAPWLRTDIYEPWSRGELPDVECFRGSSDANKRNLREGYLEHFSARLSEQEKAVRLRGDFFDLSGLAFGHLWRRDVHIIDPVEIPAHWNAVVAIDFHPRKKHTAVLIAASPDGERTIVVSEFAKRGVPSQYALDLAEWIESTKLMGQVRDVVCDSLGNSELTGGHGELSFISVLNQTWREECIPLRCRGTTYAEKSDEAIVQMMQEVLHVPEEPDQLGRQLPLLQFFKNCTGSIFDIENVCWLKVKQSELLKPKLDTAARDYFSCIKYALAAQPARINRRGKTVRTAGRSPWSGRASNKGDMRYNKRSWRQTERDDD
jgi:hypothetical protein